MTPSPLVTARAGTSLEEARRILGEHRLEKLPLVDDDGLLVGLITVKDILKATDHPNASMDERGGSGVPRPWVSARISRRG